MVAAYVKELELLMRNSLHLQTHWTPTQVRFLGQSFKYHNENKTGAVQDDVECIVVSAENKNSILHDYEGLKWVMVPSARRLLLRQN